MNHDVIDNLQAASSNDAQQAANILQRLLSQARMAHKPRGIGRCSVR